MSSSTKVITIEEVEKEHIYKATFVIPVDEPIPNYMMLPSPPPTSRQIIPQSQSMKQVSTTLPITSEEVEVRTCEDIIILPMPFEIPIPTVIPEIKTTETTTEAIDEIVAHMTAKIGNISSSINVDVRMDNPGTNHDNEIPPPAFVTIEPISIQQEEEVVSPPLPPAVIIKSGRTPLKSKLKSAQPPTAKIFTAPDGSTFTSKAQWRDYMVLTYYSFKNKLNAELPLIKMPGDVSGQAFEISECSQSTLVIMDMCEQVQIDEVHNCRIFIGACASSVFIRNCSNCVFYTCCRQLRLRDVSQSNFYTYSMSEIHIEYSTLLRFAPFNGGYPEQSAHFQSINLDPSCNLWYDIYDHNDPTKSHVNWSLLPVEEYEPAWFPTGIPCDPTVTITVAGGVFKHEDISMQSFSIDNDTGNNKSVGIDSESVATTATASDPLEQLITLAKTPVTIHPLQESTVVPLLNQDTTILVPMDIF